MKSGRKAERARSTSGHGVRGSPEYLRRVAILEIGGTRISHRACIPREIAVAFPDDRPPLMWLVAPEADWRLFTGNPSDADRNALELLGVGRGMPPAQVAHELAKAVEGCVVYARNWTMARMWVETLFSAIGMTKPPFEVLNIDRLVQA
jgi:hypothetical protein